MKVSFIVPIYKKKATQLQACLESLKTQSHKDIEVIGVFDGPDETLQNVFKDFEQGKRFSSLVIEHGGAPRARNAGAEIATGDVIAFWDADCYAEPEMTAMWIRTFDDNPDCDFVYSGYRWTDSNREGYKSEAFDPWVLEKYNYIASMFPVKREKFLKWDESLTGLQDWDYWRRIVKAGSKGRWIPGFGFATDYPDENSISGKFNVTKERIRKVREKHEDVKKDILVFGTLYKRECVHLAKLLDADYFLNPFWRIEDYKMVIMLGFHAPEVMEGAGFFSSLPKETVKIIYWMGLDAESYYTSPYHDVKRILPRLNTLVDVNFCDSQRTEDMLVNMELKPEVVTFPREEGIPCTELPAEFKVLALADDQFKGHLDALVKAVPNLDIEVVQPETPYDINKYTVGMQFARWPKLLNASRNMLMSGRYMVSNVQEPFAGYVDTSDVTKFKEEVIKKLFALKDVRTLNTEAQEYYLGTSSREDFKARLLKLLPTKLEVVP